VNGRHPFPQLELRPVEPDDYEALVAAFRRLSPQSQYRRFFTGMADPSAFVAQHLRVVDGEHHGALVVLDGDTIVAEAQWDRMADPDEAEIAIAVADEWQHRGLGRALMRALAADARAHGVGRLTASVLSENRPGLTLAARGEPATVEFDGPEARFTYLVAS
jgi:acetyltransferase